MIGSSYAYASPIAPVPPMLQAEGLLLQITRDQSTAQKEGSAAALLALMEANPSQFTPEEIEAAKDLAASGADMANSPSFAYLHMMLGIGEAAYQVDVTPLPPSY